MMLEILVVLLLVSGGAIVVKAPGHWVWLAPVFTVAAGWLFAKYFERRRPR